MNFLKKNKIVLLLVLICILSRVPQLVSADLRLDSDECVMAMMTKYMYQGKELPVYFWGQRYGFSLIEELAILPFYAICGVSAISVKLGMLLLWTLGIIFFYKALLHINNENKTTALLITLLFIATPAWALWSMKARGGYLTAHLLSAIVLYLTFHRQYSQKVFTYILTGILLYFIYESQVFWLVGLAPLLFYKIILRDKSLKSLFIIIPIIPLWLCFEAYKKTLPITYEVGAAQLNMENIWQYLNRFPQYLYNSLHGVYHFDWAYEHYFTAGIFALVFAGALLLLTVNGFVHLFKRTPYSLFFACSTAFIPLTVIYSLFSETTQFRYLLPVTAYTLVSLYIFFGMYKMTKQLKANIIAIITIGFISVSCFHTSQWLRSDREPLKKAMQYLKDNDIHYVYCMDYTFQWDIIFNSNEEVVARYFNSPGRYPLYDSLVDNAFYSNKKIAVFGHSDRRFGDSFSNCGMDDVYYICVNPDKALIKKHFQFSQERITP